LKLLPATGVAIIECELHCDKAATTNLRQCSSKLVNTLDALLVHITDVLYAVKCAAVGQQLGLVHAADLKSRPDSGSSAMLRAASSTNHHFWGRKHFFCASSTMSAPTEGDIYSHLGPYDTTPQELHRRWHPSCDGASCSAEMLMTFG
jgi:hypothetical protein